MTPDSRIVPKPIFLTSERRPLVYFVTSNSDKLMQARLIFAKYGLELQAFQDPPAYIEDYAQSKSGLLETGVREIARSVGSSALFFLEDTSARIEALSEPNRDVPGLAIKDWFSSERAEELSQRIQAEDLDPGATVRSDIALHLPGLDRVIFFSGETRGRVATSPPSFEQDPRYPWLRPDTFNGWLIPEGADRPLGAMDFEQSLAFDFRAIAIRKMLDRIEEYVAALNMPGQAYAVRARNTSLAPQLPLEHPRSFLVVGYTCAGKTTFGEHAASLPRHSVHIEASHVMRTIPLPEEAPTDIDAFARASLLMLQGGFDVVARRVLELYSNELSNSFVITGFRTLQELHRIAESLPTVEIVYIESSEATRYSRYLERHRPGDDLSLDRFRSRDSEHEFFGLLDLADQVADIRIRNEDRLNDYFGQVTAVLSGRWSRTRGVSSGASKESLERSQLLRILRTLPAADRGISPAEIEELTRASGKAVARSSVRKVLTDSPLVRKVEDAASSLYSISEAGLSYLWLVDRRLQQVGVASID